MGGTNSDLPTRRNNMLNLASLLFKKMTEKYGGTTTLNELTMLVYGFVCDGRGDAISVMEASRELQMPKSTVSRILTGMRAKGLVFEETHPTDRRRRIFRLADAYTTKTHSDIAELLDWCATPENNLH